MKRLAFAALALVAAAACKYDAAPSPDLVVHLVNVPATATNADPTIYDTQVSHVTVTLTDASQRTAVAKPILIGGTTEIDGVSFTRPDTSGPVTVVAQAIENNQDVAATTQLTACPGDLAGPPAPVLTVDFLAGALTMTPSCPTDAGQTDAGADAGPDDGGSDAGSSDAGTTDAGADGGDGGP